MFRFVLNLASPALRIDVSFVDFVPPGKFVPHNDFQTERRFQLDCNVTPAQRHPDSVGSGGVV